jgi:hypothetical protein
MAWPRFATFAVPVIDAAASFPFAAATRRSARAGSGCALDATAVESTQSRAKLATAVSICRLILDFPGRDRSESEVDRLRTRSADQRRSIADQSASVNLTNV